MLLRQNLKGEKMTKYKVGDVVQLKSGGPLMTISSLSNLGGTDYGCTWFNGKKLERARFEEEILQEPESKK